MKKFQRGIICATAIYPSVTSDIFVTDPLTSNQFLSAQAVRSGFRFNSDGSIDERGPATTTYTQVNVGEWSANEPSETGANYDIRCASINSGAWNTAAATTGTWVNLGTSREWSCVVLAKNSPDVSSCSGEFEIRDASTLTILTTFTCSAEASN